MSVVLLTGLALVGCERAARFPPVTITTNSTGSETEPARLSPLAGWLPVRSRPDIPIRFVHPTDPGGKWQSLSKFWTHSPEPLHATAATVLAGSPLAAAALFHAVDRTQVIYIKIPLGLPPLEPLLPSANRPSYRRWRLGKRLFFDKRWLTIDKDLACADCHDPRRGFTSDMRLFAIPERNALSLINCAYRKELFWDGRVRYLEEVLLRNLEEPREAEALPLHRRPEFDHNWYGCVHRLRALPEYRSEFNATFGLQWPTADAAAKALATYLRTILSGNSIWDRAVASAQREGKPIDWRHFAPILKDAAARRSLHKEEFAPEDVAKQIVDGHRVFRSSAARCSRCHFGWDFSDGGYHNISIRESDHTIDYRDWDDPAYGRFRALPIGLKTAALVGAFRTPSLRNLPRTAPYFHDGSAASLAQVLRWYTQRLHQRINARLDPHLRSPTGGVADISFTPEQAENLILFLRCLDGEPVPDIVKVP